MAKPELLPYKQESMPERYVELFGEEYGWSIFAKHRFDTFEFEDRFADKLVLTSAVARYALFGIRPFPGRQPDDLAEDILNDRHPFNLLFTSDGVALSQSTHDAIVRTTSERKYGEELRVGDIKAFGPLSDGIPTNAAIALIESVRSTLEEL